MLPLTTTQLEVIPAGELTLDAQRRPIAAAGVPRGPYGGHVSELDAAEAPPEERTGVQLRAVSVHLEPAAWPIAAGDQLRIVATGELLDVTGAVLRDQLPPLEHVRCTARRVDA